MNEMEIIFENVNKNSLESLVFKELKLSKEVKKCPCCSYLTIDDTDIMINDICEVCFWQYDEVAHKNPDVIIGANAVSLHNAIENFRLYNASEKRFVDKVRKPYEDEFSE